MKGHDCVVCPYHGWAFDAEGVLRDVPAAEKAEAWPRKKLVDSYVVEEKVTWGFGCAYCCFCMYGLGLIKHVAILLNWKTLGIFPMLPMFHSVMLLGRRNLLQQHLQRHVA